MCVCTCVCVCVRERERERVCVCDFECGLRVIASANVWLRVGVRAIASVSVFVLHSGSTSVLRSTTPTHRCYFS